MKACITYPIIPRPSTHVLGMEGIGTKASNDMHTRQARVSVVGCDVRRAGKNSCCHGERFQRLVESLLITPIRRRRTCTQISSFDPLLRGGGVSARLEISEDLSCSAAASNCAEMRSAQWYNEEENSHRAYTIWLVVQNYSRACMVRSSDGAGKEVIVLYCIVLYHEI